MVIFDANMILRFLLNDNKEMADIAERHLETGEVMVTIEVVAEVVYVLKGVYSLGREVIVATIKNFLNFVICEKCDVLSLAFDTYGTYNLDFIDCVLYAYNKVYNFTIATFDKKLMKIIMND